MIKKQAEEWLALSDVSSILGMHPSTVRTWADQGILPVYRTQGGHRRFLKKEIDLWVQTSRQKKEVKPENALRDVLRQIRFKIGENQLQSENWYQKLDEEARLKYRMSGKILCKVLQAISAQKVKMQSQNPALWAMNMPRAGADTVLVLLMQHALFFSLEMRF